MMAGDNCRLNLDHSSISYNYAYNNGGGVYVNNSRCSISMVQSHIDNNISRKNGGGIYADDDYFRLEGDAEQNNSPEEISDWNDESLGSTVSGNYVLDSASGSGGGGGLYLNESKCIVNGINFANNTADKDGSGGGIYIYNKDTNVKNCNIVCNLADMLGGGIKVDNSGVTVENCTIYGNGGRDTGGAGGGIYVCGSYNLNISGRMIIRKNNSSSYTNDNLYLAGWGTVASSALINPTVSSRSDIHIRKSPYHPDRISVIGTFNENYYTYDNADDNDPGRHIGWHSEYRYLEIMSGNKPVKTVETFIPDSGRRTQSVTGGYTAGSNNYELLRGVFEYPAYDDSTTDLEGIFYYSDGYFMEDTNKYNEHLATMSFCLAGASGYSNIGGTSNAMSYLDKSNNFR